MKTLRDYGDSYMKDKDYFFHNAVPDCFAKMLSENVKEVKMLDDEFRSFLLVYDQVLPWNWDGKSFRGININR